MYLYMYFLVHFAELDFTVCVYPSGEKGLKGVRDTVQYIVFCPESCTKQVQILPVPFCQQQLAKN